MSEKIRSLVQRDFGRIISCIMSTGNRDWFRNIVIPRQDRPLFLNSLSVITYINIFLYLKLCIYSGDWFVSEGGKKSILGLKLNRWTKNCHYLGGQSFMKKTHLGLLLSNFWVGFRKKDHNFPPPLFQSLT